MGTYTLKIKKKFIFFFRRFSPRVGTLRTQVKPKVNRGLFRIVYQELTWKLDYALKRPTIAQNGVLGVLRRVRPKRAKIAILPGLHW